MIRLVRNPIRMRRGVTTAEVVIGWHEGGRPAAYLSTPYGSIPFKDADLIEAIGHALLTAADHFRGVEAANAVEAEDDDEDAAAYIAAGWTLTPDGWEP